MYLKKSLFYKFCFLFRVWRQKHHFSPKPEPGTCRIWFNFCLKSGKTLWSALFMYQETDREVPLHLYCVLFGTSGCLLLLSCSVWLVISFTIFPLLQILPLHFSTLLKTRQVSLFSRHILGHWMSRLVPVKSVSCIVTALVFVLNTACPAHFNPSRCVFLEHKMSTSWSICQPE